MGGIVSRVKPILGAAQTAVGAATHAPGPWTSWANPAAPPAPVQPTNFRGSRPRGGMFGIAEYLRNRGSSGSMVGNLQRWHGVPLRQKIRTQEPVYRVSPIEMMGSQSVVSPTPPPQESI